ncbi:hypothetical protein [Azospirillum doebereinerae]
MQQHGKGEGLSGHGLRTTPDSPSPSPPLRGGSPPSPGAGEGLFKKLHHRTGKRS